jgi:hypothetical protein
MRERERDTQPMSLLPNIAAIALQVGVLADDWHILTGSLWSGVGQSDEQNNHELEADTKMLILCESFSLETLTSFIFSKWCCGSSIF